MHLNIDCWSSFISYIIQPGLEIIHGIGRQGFRRKKHVRKQVQICEKSYIALFWYNCQSRMWLKKNKIYLGNVICKLVQEN